MGIGENIKEFFTNASEKLKDIYFSMEEKWYDTLDKIDEHIPIYKIVDPIDRVVPSFALFLILVFILLLVAAIAMMGMLSAQSATLKLTVIDKDGKGVEGAEVSLEGREGVYYSNDYGLVEDINVNLYDRINVSASKEGKNITQPVQIDNIVKEAELQFIGIVFGPSYTSKTLQILNELGSRINDEVSIAFSCSSGASAPADVKIYDGIANIQEPDDCGVLTATLTSQKYETGRISVVNTSNTIVLKESIPKETVRVTINIKYAGVFVTEAVPIQVFKAGISYIADDTKNASNGQAVFDVIEGEYTFKTKAEFGYRVASTSIVNVTKTMSTEPITITLEKSLLGLIDVKVTEGINNFENAYVTLLKSNSPVNNKTSDSNGFAQFSITEDGNYKVEVTKDNYCPQVKDANIGSSLQFAMTKDIGQCGGDLRVRVVDQDNKPVQYAKVALFSEYEADLQKLSYVEKVTDYNGYVNWKPVSYTKTGMTYKAFAYKVTYSGWSTGREFNTRNETDVFTIKLDVPLGAINVIVKDKDAQVLQFSEVQIFEDYGNTAVSGKRLIENPDGSITFNVKADKKVYAVIKREGYESYTTLPKQIVGNGSITFNVTLSKPPVEEIFVDFLGMYKNDSKVIVVEPGQEYDALFEVTAPKDYSELGFFTRVGKDNITKTELDSIYIKDIIAPGTHEELTGASYNAPKGYSIDQKYMNLEEAKWAQAKWQASGFVKGKIMIATKVKIKSTASTGEQLVIAYRAWGVLNGSYERDVIDSEIGTSQGTTAKQELYAATKEEYIAVGEETLCDAAIDEKNLFCTTATYTDPDGFRKTFDTSFDAINNAKYNVSVKVMNASAVGFDNAKMKLENPEENLYMADYLLYTPTNVVKTGNILGYELDWVETSNFKPNSSIYMTNLTTTPRATGTGTLKLRIRDGSDLIFEKAFTVNIASDKKMKVEYMFDSKYQAAVPKIVSGKAQDLTVKVFNQINNLEIDSSSVKLYDRFGTLVATGATNKLGIATIQIPASLPGEPLTLKIEKAEYETYVQAITISEDIVEITPTQLSFTVNPQTDTEDSETVRITNMTGFDLELKEIRLTGKFSGLISDSQIESWFNNYEGIIIPSNDYIDVEFKVIVGKVVPQAADLEGTFEIVVGNEYNEWVKTVDASIRVGLGKDVDNTNCLEISQTTWTADTEGDEIEISFDVRNSCRVESTPVQLKNLGAQISSGQNTIGKFSVQSTTAYTELSQGYSRTFATTIDGDETVPVTLKYAPYGGANGTTEGTIRFEATNKADAKDQILFTELTYKINVVNMQTCIVIGADLVEISEGAEGESTSGSFNVANNCPYSVDFSVESELALSEKTFNLATATAKDVTITRNEGEIPGAYNNLVYARHGNGKQELVGNVKAILESSGCFSLSRYEYDVYDSQYSETDGSDLGYLKNTCTNKTISANVSGIIPYDTSQMWRAMLLGALAGFASGLGKQECWQAAVFSGTLWDCNSTDENSWTDPDDPNTSANIQKAYDKLKDRTIQTAAEIQTQSQRLQLEANGNASVYIKDLSTQGNALKGKSVEFYNANKATCEKCFATAVAQPAGGVKLLFADAVTTIATGANLKDKTKCLEAAEAIAVDVNAKIDASVLTQINDINKALNALDAETTKAANNLKTANGEAITETSADKSTTQGLVGSITVAKVEEKVDKQAVKNAEKLNKSVNDTLTAWNSKKDALNKKLSENKTLKVTGTTYKIDKPSTPKTWALKTVTDINKAVNDAYTEAMKNKPVVTPTTTEFDLTEAGTLKTGITVKDVSVLESQFNYTKITDEGSEYMSPEGTDEVLTLTFDEKKLTDIMLETIEEDGTSIEKLKEVDWPYEIADKDESKEKITPVEDESTTDDEQYQENAEVCSELDGTYVESLGENACDLVAGNYTPYSGEEADQFTEGTCCVESTEITEEEQSCTDDYDGVYIESIADDACDQVAGNYEPIATNYTDGTCCRASEEITEEEQSCTDDYDGIYVESIADGACNKFGGNYVQVDYSNGSCCVENEDADTVNNRTGEEVTTADGEVVPSGQFLLASTSASSGTTTSANNSMMSNLGSLFGGGSMFGVMGGFASGNALGGALTAFIAELMFAEDTNVSYSDTFTVALVEIESVALESADGVAMAVGDSTYDYDDYYTSASSSSTSSDTFVYNSEDLSATLGLAELRELTFTNPSQATNESPYQPFIGTITVSGIENLYDEAYKYDTIKTAAEARASEDGTTTEEDSDWIDSIRDFLVPPTEEIAGMTDEDLTVKSSRDYIKKFHVLFNAYEYVDCGPDTYPCSDEVIGNCQVGSKFGSTGVEAAPKIKLSWLWDNIDVDECDEDNSSYIYCDSTQFTTMLLKRVYEMKQFFRGTTLSACPQAVDVAGTKTQSLQSDKPDIAITRIQTKVSGTGATIETVVNMISNPSMNATVTYTITDAAGNGIGADCSSTQKISGATTFSCALTAEQIGTGGRFNVTATMTPELCADCQNQYTTNDTLSSVLIYGSESVQDCSSYKTDKDYFEKVLSANNALSGDGEKVLEYTDFTANLVRDAVSSDFKTDYDNYSRQIASAPTYYTTEGIGDLFLSNKFKFDWYNEPGAWEAGKYNVRMIVEFDGNSWDWTSDNNSIKSITIKMEPWGEPDPYYTIYNVAFDGMVGVESENGRNGYGSNYTQTSEEAFIVSQDGGETIYARPNPVSNAATEVNVSLDKSFYNLNSARKGNVLTIDRSGDDVAFYFSPSVAVPLILDITRNQSMDAYAYYKAEVDGKMQEMGSSFISWNGIGEGCVDFAGSGMSNWDNAADSRSDSADEGYGLRWNTVTFGGTSSFYSMIFAPQGTSTILTMTKYQEDASFESTAGSGKQLNIDTESGINTLEDVLDKVKAEEICVIGGEYFWNSGTTLKTLESSINSRQSTCISGQ